MIVVDDDALPFGKFRLRGGGSSGGHNGLASVEEHLGIREYPRLRIGIGSGEDKTAEGPDGLLRDYVLSSFSTAEEKKMTALLGKGMTACCVWAEKPLAKAMNQINAAVL